MKAAIKNEEGTFDLKEVDEPAIPTHDFVKVRVRVAGICGTDLRHWRKPEESLCGKITGHELAGEVVAVGESVTNVKPGDRVVVETVMGAAPAPIATSSATTSASTSTTCG